MATSSITKNFVVSGTKQAKQFADAIEESYQESIHNAHSCDMKITYLRDTRQIKEFMKKREEIDA